MPISGLNVLSVHTTSLVIGIFRRMTVTKNSRSLESSTSLDQDNDESCSESVLRIQVKYVRDLVPFHQAWLSQ